MCLKSLAFYQPPCSPSWSPAHSAGPIKICVPGGVFAIQLCICVFTRFKKPQKWPSDLKWPSKTPQNRAFFGPKMDVFQGTSTCQEFHAKTTSNPCIAMTARVHSVLLFTEYNWVRDVLRTSLFHALKHMKKSSITYHFGSQLCLQKTFQISVHSINRET